MSAHTKPSRLSLDASKDGLRLKLHGPRRRPYLEALERKIRALPVLGFPSTRLTYTRTYYASCWAMIAALAGATIAFVPWLQATAGLLVGYAYLQIFFMLFHVYIHANFMEVAPEELQLGPYVAYEHHYETPSALCLDEHTRVYLTPRVLAVFGAAFGVSIGCFGLTGLAVGTSALFWWAMQAPVHEYYHLPKRLRGAYYTLPMRWWLEALERAGIIGTRHHARHHEHGASDMAAARSFDDMWVPAVLSRWVDRYWIWLVRQHRPGTGRMIKISAAVMLAFQVGGAISSVGGLRWLIDLLRTASSHG